MRMGLEDDQPAVDATTVAAATAAPIAPADVDAIVTSMGDVALCPPAVVAGGTSVGFGGELGKALKAVVKVSLHMHHPAPVQHVDHVLLGPGVHYKLQVGDALQLR
jgi:hypothetical protein